jgi:hypothetical protein
MLGDSQLPRLFALLTPVFHLLAARPASWASSRS